MENITSSTPTVLKDSENSHVGLQIAFSLIAATSFTFNLLFCVMLLRNPVMLKKAHNILLFNLAVVDMLTGQYIIRWFVNIELWSTNIFFPLVFLKGEGVIHHWNVTSEGSMNKSQITPSTTSIAYHRGSFGDFFYVMDCCQNNSKDNGWTKLLQG